MGTSNTTTMLSIALMTYWNLEWHRTVSMWQHGSLSLNKTIWHRPTVYQIVKFRDFGYCELGEFGLIEATQYW